ncbi:MAG TPA: hypothetical protein VNZ47_09645 [Candidatus Dormibacteraeota bacterium]|nr:hypothetical protein [Candidatus Dormibacteraeota bacterium]
MKQQARGSLVAALLRSTAHDRFEAIVETTGDSPAKAGTLEDRPVLARAGSLLLDEASRPDFANQLANDLMDHFGAVFWVELSEQLIRDTSCKFDALGEFKRFSNVLSFIPELLWEKAALPSIVAESGTDYGIDALCRFAFESLRPNAREMFKNKFRGPESFPDFCAELLRDKMPGILNVLKAPPAFVAGIFSSVAALASYYAWVIAFDTAIRVGSVSVSGVGDFQFVAGRVVNRVDFVVDEAFLKLIQINAQKPPLPDEANPPSLVAA